MKMAKTGLSKTQRKAISLGHGTGVNVKNGRIQPAEPEVCSFMLTIKNYTTCIQTVKKEDHPLTFSSSLGGKRVCNKLLSMPKSQTPQFACMAPVLLCIGLHTVVLFSWLLCNFTNVSRHFYCGFLTETLRLGGCAINSIKGTGKAHAQAQTLNRTPRSFKKRPSDDLKKKWCTINTHSPDIFIFKSWRNEKQNTLLLNSTARADRGAQIQRDGPPVTVVMRQDCSRRTKWWAGECFKSLV